MSAERRAALRARLDEAGLGALLVTKLVNVRYLSGFTGSAGRLLVTADGAVLATDGRYLEQAAGEVGDLPVIDGRGTDWISERLGGGRLGLESHDLSWDAARALTEALEPVEVVPAPGHVEALRQHKDDAETALVARACAATDAAFAALLAFLAPGRTEREVARRLGDCLLDAGADSIAFPSIVASGPNGARPHHTPGERRLARGDLITLDFGAAVGGYASDMTRTVALGPPPSELREVYELVRVAQDAGVAAVRDQAAAGEVDAACREVITAGGHGERFVHPTGHGLGLEIHEEPILRGGSAARLARRMAVTVEPGVYLPGLGGVRIEDTVVVTADAAQILTLSPKELVVL